MICCKIGRRKEEDWNETIAYERCLCARNQDLGSDRLGRTKMLAWMGEMGDIEAGLSSAFGGMICLD